MNIFAGNLAPDTTENELTDLFKIFGPVKSALVMRELFTGVSKDFGLVDKPGKAHALSAISALDGKTVNGQPLRGNDAMARGNDGMRRR